MTLDANETYRLPVPLEEISPVFVESTLLYEDRYFYSHLGVNFVSLFRAFWQTYIAKRRVMGGSTITMQLVRQIYGTNSHSVLGKIQQIGQALWLEFLYSKSDILEAYLNLAPYGYNISGIEAASLIYFQKPSQRLNLLESMTLAVIPQNPTKRVRTISKAGKTGGELQEARYRLFKMWQKEHPGNIEEGDIVNLALKVRSPRSLPFKAPHFTVRMLSEHPKSSHISSSLDWDLQKLLEGRVRSFVRHRDKKGVENAVALLIHSGTMEVLSYVGSADFYNNEIAGQVDGIKARRSPGSALKPFVYALAIEQGLINPLTVLKDAPSGYFGSYTPDNFDQEFVGPISARDALIHSRNVPAVYLTAKVKDPSLYEFLNDAEIPLHKDPDHYGLSISLGTAEVTMEELIQLYAVLNNNGVFRRLHFQKRPMQDLGRMVLSKEAAFLTNEMLAHNPSPTQRGFAPTARKVSVAWKTGTSHGFRDAWSVGTFGDYALAVWVGDFSGKGNPQFVGRELAGHLFFDIVDALKAINLPGLYRARSPGSDLALNEVEVCAASGKLAHHHCRHKRRTWFVPGKSSISRCRVHRQIPILASNGRRACRVLSEPTVNKVYEFWPSDLLALFRKAGIGRRTPPPFDSRCLKLSDGKDPIILSPKSDVVYSLRSQGTGTQAVPLIASVDADVRKMSWYINGRFQGEYDPSATPTWRPKAGRHEVQIIDDQGRSDSLTIKVQQVD